MPSQRFGEQGVDLAAVPPPMTARPDCEGSQYRRQGDQGCGSRDVLSCAGPDLHAECECHRSATACAPSPRYGRTPTAAAACAYLRCAGDVYPQATPMKQRALQFRCYAHPMQPERQPPPPRLPPEERRPGPESTRREERRRKARSGLAGRPGPTACLRPRSPANSKDGGAGHPAPGGC